jgi:serine-type D-Ala-D-Ala endopeptidase (penicillin-binding protein 7)
MKSLVTLLTSGLLLISNSALSAANSNAQNNYNDNVVIRAIPSEIKPTEPATRSESVLGSDATLDPGLVASAALVIDQQSGEVLFEKNPDAAQPIASITKLMTAIVVLDAALPLDENLVVTHADAALARPTYSKLKVGARLTRAELLRLMLMASENRAAATLARSYPGGVEHFVRRMNETALSLGLLATRFADPTGLSIGNVSTARELTQLVRHAYHYEAIRTFSTTAEYSVPISRARRAVFHNTNRLTRNEDWTIGLSKTGFITASGQCLVLQAAVAGRPLVMVILDSWGKGGRIDDALKLRRWLEQHNDRVIVAGLSF